MIVIPPALPQKSVIKVQDSVYANQDLVDPGVTDVLRDFTDIPFVQVRQVGADGVI